MKRVAKTLGLSINQLASAAGVKTDKLLSPEKSQGVLKAQTRVKEMLEIIGRVAAWAGGKDQALTWYRAEPIPAFGGRTAEALVKDGKAAEVRDYLDAVAQGGFA